MAMQHIPKTAIASSKLAMASKKVAKQLSYQYTNCKFIGPAAAHPIGGLQTSVGSLWRRQKTLFTKFD